MERGHLTREELCYQVLDAAGADVARTTADSRQRLASILNAYPEIFHQGQRHVDLNPVTPVLIRQLLSLASNVEVAKANR